MTYAEAHALNAQGRLTRKVMTEQGWYIPTAPESRVLVVPESLPAPLILPEAKPRKTRKGKAA